MAKLFIAKESFDTTVKGELAKVYGGTTIVREGHALLKGREHLFKEIEPQYEVEKATAEPGEKRGSKKAGFTAAKKKAKVAVAGILQANTKESTKTPAKK